MNDNQEEMVTIHKKTPADAHPKFNEIRDTVREAEGALGVTMNWVLSMVEAETSFDDSLIKKIAALFKEERNQANQAQFYRKMIVKLFGYDTELLLQAAEALGFWVKDMDGKLLLSWALARKDVEEYGLKE